MSNFCIRDLCQSWPLARYYTYQSDSWIHVGIIWLWPQSKPWEITCCCYIVLSAHVGPIVVHLLLADTTVRTFNQVLSKLIVYDWSYRWLGPKWCNGQQRRSLVRVSAARELPHLTPSSFLFESYFHTSISSVSTNFLCFILFYTCPLLIIIVVWLIVVCVDDRRGIHRDGIPRCRSPSGLATVLLAATILFCGTASVLPST